jgi:hypothetical protein
MTCLAMDYMFKALPGALSSKYYVHVNDPKILSLTSIEIFRRSRGAALRGFVETI